MAKRVDLLLAGPDLCYLRGSKRVLALRHGRGPRSLDLAVTQTPSGTAAAAQSDAE
jgi:hypothetical protein|eukprot:COSAG02_NODE_26771_length_625_cov_0.785171_2_plen_56_part_00